MPKIKKHFSGVSKRQRRRLVTTHFKRLQQSITKNVELKYQKTTPHLLNLNSNQCNIEPIKGVVGEKRPFYRNFFFHSRFYSNNLKLRYQIKEVLQIIKNFFFLIKSGRGTAA